MPTRREKEQTINHKLESLEKQSKENEFIKEHLNRQIKVINQKRTELEKHQEEHIRRLEKIAALSAEEAKAWLLKFKGVGPKTASVVLQFALGKPAFPVDTHIHRVSGRVGLRPEKMTADQAHDHLAALLPPETYYAAHLNIIRLGREICHPRRPDCPICPIQTLCRYYQSQTVNPILQG